MVEISEQEKEKYDRDRELENFLNNIMKEEIDKYIEKAKQHLETELRKMVANASIGIAREMNVRALGETIIVEFKAQDFIKGDNK